MARGVHESENPWSGQGVAVLGLREKRGKVVKVRWFAVSAVASLVVVGLVWMVTAYLSARPSEFVTVPYGEGAHEYLERVAGRAGVDARRTGGASGPCDLPNGGAGQRRDVGARSTVTGAEEAVLDEVERIWLTEDLGVGASVEQVSRTPGSVMAFIDGIAVTASVTSGELVLAGAAPCVPEAVVERAR